MSELKLHDYMKKQLLILFIILKSLLISGTINFNIDMNNLQYPNEDYDNVVINGSWNDWSGWGVTLDDSDGDGIYSGSLNLNNGTYEYVIAVTGSVDNWSGWGQTINAPIGESCDFNPGDEWANYGFTINNVDLDQNYCAGSCINTCSDNNNDNEDNDNEDNDDNNEENYGGYQLIWNDEFNGSTIDDSKWNFEIGTGNWGWGNGEHQYYTSRQENAFIQDGKLIIKALFEDYAGSDYTSARMTTKNKGDWTYGKVVARIKVPSAGGTWPAFWLMPTNSVYGGWPNSGEMDIMEHYGCDPNHVHSTVHNNTYNWNGGIPPTSYSTITNATSDFHIYEMNWTEDELNFYVDGIYLGTYFKTSGGGWQQWPYNEDFYIILNLAVGSHFMQCDTEDELFPQQLEIDYVRVYQEVECSYDGDINNDNDTNVIDIVVLVDEILSNDSNFDLCLDLNQDGEINIIDIVSLVNLIIN